MADERSEAVLLSDVDTDRVAGGKPYGYDVPYDGVTVSGFLAGAIGGAAAKAAGSAVGTAVANGKG